MSENFEKLVIGSAHEGAGGMFRSETDKDENSVIDTTELRVERGIFPDAQERYEQALRDQGLEQFTDLGNGIVYPTLDQWVDHRIINKRGTKFFPSFAKDSEGKILFCKAQLSDNPDALQGLEREAERLQKIPKGVNAPHFVDFIPATEQSSAMLLTEGINATVVNPKDWFVEDAQDVVRQIKLIEDEKVSNTVEGGSISEQATSLLARAGETISKDLRQKIEEVITAFEPYANPHFVHGDLGSKNILLGKDGAYIVDWEFQGTGFLGQDAAKLWSELRKNPPVSEAFLNDYLHTPGGQMDEARKSALIFGVAVESLSHLAWRNENIIATGKQSEFPKLTQEIEDLNKRITDVIESVEKN